MWRWELVHMPLIIFWCEKGNSVMFLVISYMRCTYTFNAYIQIHLLILYLIFIHSKYLLSTYFKCGHTTRSLLLTAEALGEGFLPEILCIVKVLNFFSLPWTLLTVWCRLWARSQNVLKCIKSNTFPIKEIHIKNT